MRVQITKNAYYRTYSAVFCEKFAKYNVMRVILCTFAVENDKMKEEHYACRFHNKEFHVVQG